MKHRIRSGLILPLVLVAAVATSAQADDKATCLDAARKSQTLRNAHKLVEARDLFRVCAAAQCPAAVRDDCTNWLAEVEKDLPSVVVAAKDGAGADLVDVKVSVDGQPLLSKLDGRAVPMDAGPHMFHVEGADGTSVDRQVMVKEGETSQAVAVILGPVAAPTPTPESALSTAAVSSDHAGGGGMGTQRIIGLVVGGVGVAGIAAGSVCAVMTKSEATQQQKDCGSAGSCNDFSRAASDHSTGETDRTISLVGFVAGGALLVGGAIVLLSGGHSSGPSANTGLLLVPALVPGGGTAFLTAEF
jgi:hypothetical protein